MSKKSKKSKLGRPALKPEERKQKRQIMLPPECWEYLDDIDSSRGGTNRVLEEIISKKITKQRIIKKIK